MASPIPIRVFASHPVAERQFKRLLMTEKSMALVSEGEPFQVGIFDSESDSVEAVLTLARLKYAQMRPVMVGPSCEDNECLRWLFRGVWGLVPYDKYEEDLVRAVRKLAEGQLWFPSSVLARWMRLDAVRRESVLHLALTEREHQVMEFLLRKFSNKEIADILGISERTVKYHVSNVLTKLQVESREDLAAKWLPDLGLT